MATAIPLTKMTNDVSDFTPYAARARSELEIYEDFFSTEGEPIVVFIMVTRKGGGTMLGTRQLNETIRKGLLVNSNFNQTTSSIDLGYPSTTVLGRKFHVDTNFFGVRVEVVKEDGKREVISLDQIRAVNGRSVLDNEQAHVLNNVRDVRMVVLQLRAQKPAGALREDVERYEGDVVDFLKRNFSSTLVDVVVMTPSFLKSEIVRAGLLLAPFSLFGFLIMCVFSSVTATISATFMSQMNVGKIILAIAACVCPFMACGTALGALFWMGMRFGSILCVTPFLVLAIGVDDAFLMINSWQRNNRRLRLFPERDQQGQPKVAGVSKRIEAMFEDIGPSVTITTFTNVLAFGIGSLTPTPEIRLFCIGNASAMIVDLIYQITFFGSVMAIITRHEVQKEKKALLEKTVDNNCSKPFGHTIRKTLRSGMDKYCSIICNKYVSALILGVMTVYWSLSIYGTITMKAELRPVQLFSRDSDMITVGSSEFLPVMVLHHRDDYITPYYSTCYVFVTRPGNISEPANLRKLNELVEDFEKLPRSLGRFSTKFWLRDYEQFIDSAENILEEDDNYATNRTIVETNVGKANELLKFLDWPEFRFWKGFMHYHINKRGEVVLDNFFFTTASHGHELKRWSQRADLMHQWRSVVDKYTDLGVSVYEDDAKFLDLIGTMATQTIQSSLCTLICMVLVCLLFIKRVSAVLIATFSIVSTCIGVFGILSLWGVDLDPIVMSAVIMSIGFSVDIPAHVTYHFYKTSGTTVEARLQHCLAAITFPVLQAALSTLLCVLSLLFVPIHMSVVFVKTMVLVVVIGLIHGLIVIPVFFSVVSRLSISKIFNESTKSVDRGANAFLDNAAVSKN
ncbi:Patched domain-containing protein 3 [Toxocara canis]|uniref:Patched domain-containing protein 3 n=1 Tax=Toxocara canis TaxID=6265 RepID=A0A0B2VXC7_TOXCA|nr:Patched domain-containing protein 3 [Toxocara canis]